MKNNRKKGFTLLEVIITIAILAIVAAFSATAYTNVMEDQRKQSDFSKLNEVDVTLQEVLLYQDAFEEAKKFVYDDNKLTIRLNVTYDNVTADAYVQLKDTTINSTNKKLNVECKSLYKYITDLVGEKIDLEANSHRVGYYEIYITFNGVEGNQTRPGFHITNDGIKTSNSADKYLKEHN